MSFVLHNSDCLDPVNGLASLADKSVDHVITDPPFEAKAHENQRRHVLDGQRGDKSLSFPPITEEQRIEAARQFGRIARRWVLIFCQVEAAQKWVAAGEAADLVYRRTCIWVKPDGMPQYSGDRPGMGYETIVALHAAGASTWNGGGQHGVFVVPKGDPDRSGHPTQKPDALMDKLVRLFTDKGETVVDPFAGSASTMTACERLGRNSIGWEMDAKYHAIALKRLQAAREQMEMFGDVTADGATGARWAT